MQNQFLLAAYKALDPYPPTVRRTVKYVDLYSLSTAATTGYCGTNQKINLNGLYDPDYTGTGHQPYGYDQLMAVYNKYRVERVSFKITFTTPGATNDVCCLCTLAPGTQGDMSSYSIWKPIEWPITMHGHLSSAGARQCVLTGSVSNNEIASVSKARYDADDIYVGSTSANPSAVQLLCIAVGSYSGSASQTTAVLVEMEYDAVFFDRTTLGSS